MTDLDIAVAGLSRDKVQKVSMFRIQANMFLAKTSQRSMPLDQAVKFLHAAKFNVEKAEEILKNYEKHKQAYDLENLHTHRQRLNSGIRSKKLEILGARDPDGAQLLLFTASKHDSKSCDHKTSMQLLFLILDQVSESQETQSKGVTLIADIRDCSFSSYDFKYTSQMLAVLYEGYPLYLKMVYIIEAPIWFKLGHPNLQITGAMQRESKVKMVTLQDLKKHLPESALPSSLGGSLFPTRAVTATAGAMALESPVRSTNRKLPMAPPRQRTSEHRRSYPNIASISPADPEDKPDTSGQPQAGAVNKMKGLFEQKKDEHQLVLSPQQIVQSDKRTNGHRSGGKPHPPQIKPQLISVAEGSKVKLPMMPLQQTREKGIGKRPTTEEKKDDRLTELVGIFNRGNNSKTPLKSEKEQDGRSLPNSEPEKKSIWKPGRGMSSQAEADSGKTKEEDTTKHSKPNSVLVPFSVLNPGKTDGMGPNKTSAAQTLASSAAGHGDNKKSAVYEGYETVEFKPLPSSQSGPGHLKPPASPTKSSSASTSRNTPKTSTSHSGPTTLKSKPMKTPGAKSIPPLESKPLPSKPSNQAKPPKSEYENIQIKRGGANSYVGDSDSDEEGGEVLGIGGGGDEVIYENFGPDEGNRWMSARELQQYVNSKEKKGLSAEYYKIKNEPLSGPFEAFKLAEKSKVKLNRYRDVVCYDETRVVLSTLPGIPGSDYIHANYVNGYKKPKAFIVTQGPMKKTVDDFWRMLWEQRVFVVVMTTKCVELGKLKCAQYWPDGSDTVQYGDVSVACSNFELRDSFEVRRLHIQCKGEARTLMHYQFIAWPDYGVPSSSNAVLDLVYSVREMQGRFPEYTSDKYQFRVHGPPVVIHCSAGIGRSGTFAALDYCIDELREKGRVNVQHAVRQLRSQRAFSIQTDEQYEFTYRTVMDYALSLTAAMKR